jgi:5-methylthioadenosine/S-adenosylhomocysteine deaminase
MSSSLVTDVMVVPMDGPPNDPLGDVRRGSIRIHGGRIAAIGALEPEPGETAVAGDGMVALPGFVQGHLHYCQTLFRGLADDLPLMDWLQRRIWPLEAAHDDASTRASARLSVAELLLGGTTTTQVMESVRHAEQSCAVAAASGMTTVIGNCLMDLADPHAPAGLSTTTDEALELVASLHQQFHGMHGRIHYAVSPRFILSCTDELARAAAEYANAHGLAVHTHACEHPDEIALVRARTGRDYILALHDQGLLSERTSLAHCVHTTHAERDALVATGTAILHCPTTNLKLGSGLAPIAEYRSLGLRVGLGADGAACNNRLSMLTELRQAALLQATIAGPGTWPAATALHAATAGGAAALGLADEVGSLTPGKRADLVLFDLSPGRGAGLGPGGDLVSRLVFTAETANVRHVMVGGEWCVRDGALTSMDAAAIADDADRQLTSLLSRAGLAR